MTSCDNCGVIISYCNNCGSKLNKNDSDNSDNSDDSKYEIYNWHIFARVDNKEQIWEIHWDNKKHPSISTKTGGLTKFWNKGEIDFVNKHITFYCDSSVGYISKCVLYKSACSDTHTISKYLNSEKFEYDKWAIQDQFSVTQI